MYVAKAVLVGEGEKEGQEWARLMPPREGWEALTGGKVPLPVVEVVVESD